MKKQYSLLAGLSIELAFSFVVTETLFRLFSFQMLFDASFLRIELFALSAAILCGFLFSLLPMKPARILTSLLCILFSVYAITQMQFINYYGSYMSVKASFDGAGRISEFAGEFINRIPLHYYLLLIPPLLVCIANLKVPFTRKCSPLQVLAAVLLFVLAEGGALASVWHSHYETLYRNPCFITRAIREFGSGRYLIRDVLSIGSDSSETLTLQPEETPAPVSPASEDPETAKPEPEVTEAPSAPSRRNDIDDSSWISMMEAEEDPDIKEIDRYLLSRDMTDYNDRTDMFQDYSVVYIMIEAFDYMAIDPILTPTITMMKENGWDFSRHYTPKFSCATGESEFVSEISLVPRSDVCTPNQYADNTWNNSIFSLFEHAGYYSSAYHNWKDEFYERRTLYSHSGCEAYYNFEDLDYHQLWGWQSDLEMMELTIPYWIDQDRFFSLYVTSSTHFPYDQESELGNRYISEIDKVHPDYPIEVKRYLSKSMELDKALAYLIGQLEEAGKMDSTMIVLFADHHPLETPIRTLAEYGGQEADRLDGLNEDRTPLIFYTSSMKPEVMDRVSSTFDILPTLLNLVGIEYEPRIFAGSDYFDPASELVIFPNGSWITDDGAYYASTDTFDETITPEEAEQRNREVANLFSVSQMIYDSDYFAHRPSIPFPSER